VGRHSRCRFFTGVDLAPTRPKTVRINFCSSKSRPRKPRPLPPVRPRKLVKHVPPFNVLRSAWLWVGDGSSELVLRPQAEVVVGLYVRVERHPAGWKWSVPAANCVGTSRRQANARYRALTFVFQWLGHRADRDHVERELAKLLPHWA
jgi:hypothetical protein